jgi:hypothetical protein
MTDEERIRFWKENILPHERQINLAIWKLYKRGGIVGYVYSLTVSMEILHKCVLNSSGTLLLRTGQSVKDVKNSKSNASCFFI